MYAVGILSVHGDGGIQSINYAVKVLGCPLIVVLGHENCGAVKAVWQKKGAIIPFINKEIFPSLDYKNPQCSLGCQVKNNVNHIVDLLNKTPQFETELKNGSLKAIGAFYPFISCKVEFLQKR